MTQERQTNAKLCYTVVHRTQKIHLIEFYFLFCVYILISIQNTAFFPDSFHLIRWLSTKFSPLRTSKEIDVPSCFFSVLHRLYKERLSQVDIKLQEVMAGCAQEYLEPLANLQENMQIRTKVAGSRTNWTTADIPLWLKRSHELFSANDHSRLSQGSTGSCAWSRWRTSMNVRSRLPANTGR